MSAKRIAVIGAGPMGLAVAYELARQGQRPVVFEADDRVGGMTAVFDFGGMTLERYYHFHCISDRAFLTVLDELGLADRMRWVETRMGYFFRGEVQPWGNPLALLQFRGLGLVAKFRYGLHAFLATKRSDWRPLDRLEATGWIKQWIGSEAYEVLWRKLFDYKFYDYADKLSAAWIWSRIRRIGRSRYSLFREKLGYLEGGSDTLLSGMEASIVERGGEFRLKTPVERVAISGGRVAGVVCNGELAPFDVVVSTIPLPYVPGILAEAPPEVRRSYLGVKNIAVVCVIVKLRKSVSENFWLNVNDPEMDIPGIVEYTNLRPMERNIVYVPFYMPGEHPKYSEPDAVFNAKARSYLGRINPLLSEADFEEVRVSRYRFAQPVCGPGFLDTIPDVRLPIDGLWVADTSYYYPEDRGISESIQYGRNLARRVL